MDDNEEDDEDPEAAFDRLLQNFLQNELDEIARENKNDEKDEDEDDNEDEDNYIENLINDDTEMIVSLEYYNRRFNLPFFNSATVKATNMKIISEYEIIPGRKSIEENNIIRINKDKSQIGAIIFNCDKKYDGQKITAFIYRLDNEEPTRMYSAVKNGTVRFEFDWDSMRGHYFILFDNIIMTETPSKNFNKSILENRSDCNIKINVEVVSTNEIEALPKITDIVLKLINYTDDIMLPTKLDSADCNVAKYSDCGLFMSVPTDKSISNLFENLSTYGNCRIFNSTYLTVGGGNINTETDEDELADNFCGFYANLGSKYRWLPDDYKIIVYYKKSPLYEITFTIDNDFNINNVNYRAITLNSFEFHKLKFIETKDEDLKFDLHFPDIRKAVFEWAGIGTLNTIQNDKCNNIIIPNRNFIVECNHSRELISVIEEGINEAFDNKNQIRRIDANKFLEPVINCTDNEIDDLKSHDHIVIYNLNAFSDGKAKAAINILAEKMTESTYSDVILMGNKTEIETFFEAGGENMRKFFPQDHYLKINNLDANTIMHIINEKLKFGDMKLHDDAAVKLYNCLKKAEKNNALVNWDSNYTYLYVRDVLTASYAKRISSWGNNKRYTRLAESRKYNDIDKFQLECCDEIGVILPEDIDESYFSNHDYGYQSAIDELNSLIGLESVKRNMVNASNLAKFCLARRQLGLSSVTGTHHMIFTGNPGTGKTTVAKMVGRIYHSLGLLSKGDVIVTERSKIVGRYIGETEKNMMAILEQAQGNVLFIDEAYTLFDGADDRKDFGHHVLESLLTVLSQPNPDMIIIFAGYEDEINKMLNVNQGMEGRFPLKFTFDDYNADELYQIAMRLFNKENYVLTPEAEILLKETISDKATNKGKAFSNARWIDQYVHNGIINAMATRLIQGNATLDIDTYRTITADDIKKAYNQYGDGANKMRNTRRPIGFAI